MSLIHIYALILLALKQLSSSRSKNIWLHDYVLSPNDAFITIIYYSKFTSSMSNSQWMKRSAFPTHLITQIAILENSYSTKGCQEKWKLSSGVLKQYKILHFCTKVHLQDKEGFMQRVSKCQDFKAHYLWKTIVQPYICTCIKKSIYIKPHFHVAISDISFSYPTVRFCYHCCNIGNWSFG